MLNIFIKLLSRRWDWEFFVVIVLLLLLVVWQAFGFSETVQWRILR